MVTRADSFVARRRVFEIFAASVLPPWSLALILVPHGWWFGLPLFIISGAVWQFLLPTREMTTPQAIRSDNLRRVLGDAGWSARVIDLRRGLLFSGWVAFLIAAILNVARAAGN